jgi:transcriptional regulator with XRE-family HTH domain
MPVNTPTYTDKFREVLETLKKERGLTWGAFAAELGVNEGQVHRWRRGESRPSIAKAQDLAAKFDMSVSEFLGLDGSDD